MSRRGGAAGPGGRVRRKSRTRRAFPVGWALAAAGVAGCIVVTAIVGMTRLSGSPPARNTGGQGAASHADNDDRPAASMRAASAEGPAAVRTVAASHDGAAARGPRTGASPTRAPLPLPAMAPAAAARQPSTTSPSGPPRAAIVIDDCGERLDLMQRAIRIRAPLTFAVIPHLRASSASAELGFSSGHEVILHQPMEPSSPAEDPGQGVLQVGMKADQVARVLRRNLEAVPHVVGLNHHMGSRATADATLMGHVLAATRSLRGEHENLYFLDSRTSAETVGFEVARRLGVPTAMRNVFLDNDADPVSIRKQLDLLLSTAAAQGEAIGIGHLKPETLAVLEAVLPAVPERECRFVFVSELVR